MYFLKLLLLKFKSLLYWLFWAGPKAILVAIKKGIIATCWAVLRCFDRPATTNSSKLPDLCPTDDAKYVDAYIDMLNETLINREQTVREIAITSPYSGGKSSLLNTYIRKTPFLKFTSISLASFKDLSQGVGVDSPDENTAPIAGTNASNIKQGASHVREDLSKIEKSIVQQLLYRTDSKKTPNSRFRRIFPLPVSYFQAISIATSLVFWGAIIGGIHYLPTFSLKNLIESVLSTPKLTNINLWFLSYLVSLPLLVVRDLYKNLSGYNISKFNPAKGELAFEQQKKDSIFNIYLDEIIYFFASQKSNVVIFEDLDRFQNTEVFIKLKELNKLINDSKDVKQKVRFIYALRDDVFKGKDRTKFFDVIIPIIPIASKANSYPQLKELIQNSNLIDDVEDSFLRGISVYVDDMRMLKNIVTEFGIYKNTLIKNLEHLNLTKLFAFIVYKNVYCDDFALLHSGKGDLITFFSDIANLKSEKEESIEAEINQFKQRSLDSEHELTSSLKELNASYVLSLLPKINTNHGVYEISGHRIDTIKNPEVFDELLLDKSQMTYRINTNNNYQSVSFNFGKFLDELLPNYDERKRRIIDKSEEVKLDISKQVDQLNVELSLLHELPITRIIKACSRQDVFKNIADKHLLVLLLERGYIDQHYDEYISHFHEGHMTLNDMAFIRNVQSDENADPLCTVDNYEEALKYLSDEDYKKGTFLNYQLFDHMLGSKNPFPVFRFIENHLAGNSNRIQLVRDGLKNLVNKEAWIVAVIHNFNNYWKDLITEQSIIQKDKQLLLIHSIDSLPSKGCNDYLKDAVDELQNFLNENESIGQHFAESELDDSKIFSVFRYLDVKFQHLSHIEEKMDFLALVLKNQLFEVHEANLSLIAEKLFGLKDNNRDFSCLKAIEDEDFKRTFDTEIEQIALRLSHGHFSVSNEGDYIWLLNNKDISIDTRINIIKTHNFIIDDIRSLNNRHELSIYLLEAQRIPPNWSNTEYLCDNDSIPDKPFKEYLNNNYEALCSEKETNLSNEAIESYLLLILDDRIEMEAFESYFVLFNYQYTNEQLKEIPEPKLASLIENAQLQIDIDTYEALIEAHKELSIVYLAKYFDYFVIEEQLDESLSIDSEVFYRLLESSKLSSIQRKILIESRNSLIDTNLDQDVLRDALGYQEVTKGIDISDSDIPKIPMAILERIISASDAKFNKVLLTGQLQYLSDSEAIHFLELAKIDFTQALTAKRSFKVENDKVNTLLATVLECRSLISSFKEQKNKLFDKEKPRIEIFVKKSLNVE